MTEPVLRLTEFASEAETPTLRLQLQQQPRFEQRTPRAIQRDSEFYAIAADVPLGESRAAVENGWTGGLQNSAEANANLNISSQVEQSLEEDEEPDIEGLVNQLREVEMFRRFLPESMVQAIRTGAIGADQMALDRIARLVYTGEQIEQRMESMRGIGRTAVDVGEMILDPFDVIYQRRYKNLVERYERLLTPGTSMEDFERGLNEILTEAQDAGFFSNENRFFFAGFLDTLANGVYSPEQLANDALSWMDVGLTLGTLGIARGSVSAMRGLRQTTAMVTAQAAASGTPVTTGVVARGVAGAVIDAGRDSLSAINLLRPSASRDRVIQESLEERITFERAEDVNLPMHLQPSVATPTTVRGNYWTAPNHNAARTFEVGSRILDEVMESAASAGRVFDDETLRSFGARLRDDRLRYLRESGFTRIIDVDVGVDELNNLVSMDIIGTTKGGFFKSESSARAASQYGDDVLQMADGTWAIFRRNNISADNLDFLKDLGYTDDLQGLMLYRATDPENLGDGFFARFGSPQAQADAATSSNLYLAESVLQKTMSKIQGRLNKITRGMSGRSIGEVYNAFEAMARTAERKAMTLEQFDSWFVDTFKREPTDTQRALYLTRQEMLDAELFVTANEVYRRAVDMNGLVVREGSVEHIVRPTRTDELKDTTLVFDSDQGRVIPVSEIGERKVYTNIGSSEIPGNVQFITGVAETRALRHSDFFARNAGGHRGYVLNEMQFLVKQRSVRLYADGSERETTPNTLLGARTRQEADKAVENVNAIIDELNEVLPVGRMTADEYLDALDTMRSNKQLNNAIDNNKGWNPEVDNVEELVSFARERGLDLRTRFNVVAEGDDITDLVKTLDSNPYMFRGMTQMDQTRMSVMQGGRGSLPLTKYGGGQIAQRSTQDVLDGAMASSMARMTETAYRIRAGKGLIRGAFDAGVLKEGYKEIQHLPLRTQLERIKADNLIDTSGATGVNERIGRKFQLDLERLLFRLRGRSSVAEGWESLTRRVANFFYQKGFTYGVRKFDRWSTDPLSAMRGLAFDAYLGMFNPSQLLMQSIQVVNIMGIAGFKGIQGASLYGPVRFLLNSGSQEVLERVARLTENITGLDAEQLKDMVELLRSTGRGVVDNNFAEMTPAEDASSSRYFGRSNFARGVRTFREGGRVFFKEGDLVARISAFNTAYLEAIEKFGRRTAKNNSKFVRYITNREQVLTQNMTAASRQGYEQLPFMQFMTYQLRINEAILAGTFSNTKSVLTKQEKLRLAFTHLAMFGAMSNTLTGVVSEWAEANYNIEADERLIRLAQRGLLDSVLSYISGVDTAASSRFSSGMGLYNIMTSIAQDHPFVFLAGPSGQFTYGAGETAISTIYQGLRAIATGNTGDFLPELADFVRLTSSGNYTYNAITAYRYGEYLTKRSALVTDDLDARHAVFLAFGIPLEEIDSIYNYMAQDRFMTGFRRNTANRITEMNNQIYNALRRGDYQRAAELYGTIAHTLQMYEPWEREEIERMVRRQPQSMTDSFMVELFRRDVESFDQTR